MVCACGSLGVHTRSTRHQFLLLAPLLMHGKVGPGRSCIRATLQFVAPVTPGRRSPPIRNTTAGRHHPLIHCPGSRTLQCALVSHLLVHRQDVELDVQRCLVHTIDASIFTRRTATPQTHCFDPPEVLPTHRFRKRDMYSNGGLDVHNGLVHTINASIFTRRAAIPQTPTALILPMCCQPPDS